MKYLKLLMIIFLSSSLFIFYSCAGSQQTTAAYNPNFVWAPPTTNPSSSANLTFALIQPQYGQGTNWSLQAFPDFSAHLGNSFQELLIAKGFNIVGPFNSLNDLTFQDKKNSELAIYPSLNIYIRFLNNKWDSDFGANMAASLLGSNNSNQFQLSGNIIIGGQVSIIAIEPLSGEKMWVKNINLTDTTVSVKGELSYYGIGANAPGSLAGMEVPPSFFKDNGIEVPVAKALESYFSKLLNVVQSYVDVDEMHTIQKQVKEIRAKKVF